MSAEATAWAWKRSLDDTVAKFVLLLLADQADHHGFVTVTQSTLAEIVEVTRNTIQRKLILLRDRGAVEAYEPAVQRRPSLYWLRIYTPDWNAPGVLEQLIASGDADKYRYAADLIERYPSLQRSDATSSLHGPRDLDLALDLDLPEAKDGEGRKNGGRRRDLSFEALVEATGANLAVERGAVNAALRAIRQSEPGVSDETLADLIRTRAENYRHEMEGMALTPTSLAKHWVRVQDSTKRDRAERVASALGLGKDEW